MSTNPANPPGPVGRPGGNYWGYWDRPYSGCGCLWIIFIVIIVWWFIALAWEPARFGQGWWPGQNAVPPAGAPAAPDGGAPVK